MGKLGKFLGILVCVVVLVLIGLAVFVRFYLTDDRIKAVVIPQAEKNLGRKVVIGDIHVGLLSGISMDDFIIKEPDQKTDFVNVSSFILSYDLLPLFKKKLVVSEISLTKPTVHILRDKTGKFNFESLKIMKGGEAKTTKDESGATTVLPIGLTVEKIGIEKAELFVEDELGELPTVEAEANAKISVNMGQDLSSLRYQGTMDFVSDSVYGDIKPHIKGKGDFDQTQMKFAVSTDLDKEQIKLNGTIQNYAQTPAITLNVTSELLNIDHLLGLTAGLPKQSGKNTPSVKTEKTKSASQKTAPASGIPPGLVAQGQVKVDQALYKGVSVKNFLMQYSLVKGILTVKNLSAKTLGGELNSDMEVDLNQSDLVYEGKLGVRSMQVADLNSAFAKQASDIVSGTLESDLTFSGAGTQWEQIRKLLTSDGSFSLKNGRIRNTSVTKSVADILGLPEINDISFQEANGTFQITKGGRVALNSTMNSQDIKFDTDGSVTLDGALDLPLTLHLSKNLSDKLKSRASIAKYLTDKEGETVLKLKLAGSVDSPRTTLDTAGVQETIKQKAVEKIEETLSGKKTDGSKGNDVEDVLKGLFGR